MSHPKFKDIGDPADRVIEEVGELLQAMSKAKRFGLFNHHPDRPERTNCDDIFAEMSDVVEAMERFQEQLRQLKKEYYA